MTSFAHGNVVTLHTSTLVRGADALVSDGIEIGLAEVEEGVQKEERTAHPASSFAFIIFIICICIYCISEQPLSSFSMCRTPGAAPQGVVFSFFLSFFLCAVPLGRPQCGVRF